MNKKNIYRAAISVRRAKGKPYMGLLCPKEAHKVLVLVTGACAQSFIILM